MPVCRKCKNHFSNRVIINGLIKNLNRRKYCLNCSPWGAHNTRKNIDHKANEAQKRVCVACKKEFNYVRGNGNGKNLCCSCLQIIRKRRIRKKLIELFGGKCVVCGYDKCIAVLDFHHRDNNKEFNIAGNYNRSFERLQKEAEKCDLLCSNCHRELHYKIDKKNSPCPDNNENYLYKERRIVKRQYYCKKCGTPIKGHNNCKKCSIKIRLNKPSKEALILMIELMPMTKIGEKYGVSSNAVKKWAIKYGLDLPNRRGFWSKTEPPHRDVLEKLLMEKTINALTTFLKVSEKTLKKWMISYGLKSPGNKYWAIKMWERRKGHIA